MRMLIAFLFAATAAHAAGVTDRVDLTAPGAFDALKQQHPDHYVRVQAILSYVETRPTQSSTRPLIEARFDASDVEMLQWRVSDPPRLRVSFTLDATRYTAEVIPSLPPARPMPTR